MSQQLNSNSDLKKVFACQREYLMMPRQCPCFELALKMYGFAKENVHMEAVELQFNCCVSLE